MKTKLYTLIILFLMSIGVSAQVDRSKQPKPGPAPKISLEVPGEFELPNGLKVLVVENHKLPRVSYNLTIDNKPIKEGDIAGVSGLLGSMLGNGTTTIPKDAFNEEIDFLGASMNFSYRGGFASSLSKYADRILELMADAAINPLLTEDEFQKEKEKSIEGIKSEKKSVDAVARRVGSALAYGTHHPYGEFITEETVNKVTLENVNAFYQKYFNPNNAYLVIVGDVDFLTIEKQVRKYFSKWEKSIDFDTTIPAAKANAQYTQINFIDMPNAVQSNISLTSNVDLKMSDPDYHAVLIANKILGGGFNSYLNMNLREEHGYTYGARSNVGSDKYKARFTAGAAVRNAVTDSAVVQTLKEINRIKSEPVTKEALSNAKAKYVGDFVLALESPQTIARYALNIKIEELPKDFYTTYLKKINAVTIADVKRVANIYFNSKNARIVVVGKGSEVLENLEKTGIPIKYFDTYANAVDKPVFSKPIPEGVTAQSIMDHYLKAVGGKDKAKTVNSLLMTANVTVEGVPIPLTAEIKSMSPNKESLEMSAEGMGVLVEQKFDGETGYTINQGIRTELTENQIKDKKTDNAIFPELYYDAANLSIESVVSVEGEDVFKIKVDGDKPTYRYYSVDTGLLSRVESTVETQGQTYDTSVNYSKYSPVNGVQIPYNQAVKSGPQVISINITNIKVNEGVTEADFK